MVAVVVVVVFVVVVVAVVVVDGCVCVVLVLVVLQDASSMALTNNKLVTNQIARFFNCCLLFIYYLAIFNKSEFTLAGVKIQMTDYVVTIKY